MNLLSSLLKYTADQIAALRAKDTSQDTTVSGINSRLITAEGDIDSLEAQFTTVVSAVTTDTEVTNIRVGDDGVTYDTAGNAVRTQFSNLSNNAEVIVGGDITVWKNIKYNNVTHTMQSATDRITSPLMPLGNGFEIKSISSNWKILAYFFSADDLTSYLSYTQYTTAPSTIAKANAKYVMITIMSTNSSTADPSSANTYATIKASYASANTNLLLKEVESGVGYEPILMENGYIACNSATIDVGSITISGTYTHAVVPCQEGDKFTINGQGGGTPALWAFISSAASNNRLTYASSNENRTNYVLTAPQNAAYLIINTSDGRLSAKGVSVGNVANTIGETITENKVFPNKSVLKKEPTIPIKLSWEDLFSIEKTICIHADNFHRADNSTEIGRNGNDTYPMEYIEYHEDVTEENDIQVGISNNEAVAFNAHYVVGTTKQIMAVDAHQFPYRFSVEFEDECCVAFGIKDIDNYFSCTCTPNSVALAKVGNVEGRWTVTSNTHNADISIVDFYVFENHVMVCVGGRVLLDNPIVTESTLCGMVFQANKISDWKYKSFAVFTPVEWTNFGYDRLIEEAGVLVGNNLIGTMETYDDDYSCTLNTEIKRFNSKSLKFDLKYSDGTGRSEINFPILWKKRLGGISSVGIEFDLLIPSDYVDESSREGFFQLHHASDGLNLSTASPNIILYAENGHMYFRTMGYEGHLTSMKEAVVETYDLGKIEKGVWHRYSIFWRQSYIKSVIPITALYVDGTLQVCTNAVNFYNSPIAAYPKFGIYKWDWKTTPTTVSERIAYFDNINFWQ